MWNSGRAVWKSYDRDVSGSELLIVPGNPRTYIFAAWILFLGIWLVAAFVTKRTARRQSAASRWLDMGEAWLAWLFLFARRAQFGPLAWRFVPNSHVVAWIGAAATIVGIGLAVVARFFLGRNWSGIVTIKQGHTLVRKGPYRFVRHPIYTGLLLAIFGTALAIGEIRALIGAGLVFALFVHKISLEESFMTEQFGADYADYRRNVKALIPFVL
jgi:protein-S-isoprenylcysteine O-methyltransferase Ste14